LLKKIHILIWLTSLITWAQLLKDELRFKFQYYDDNNGVTVYQPMAKISKTLGANTALNSHFLVDALTAASRNVRYPPATKDTSIQNIKKNPDENIFTLDAITQASQREVRSQYGIGVNHQFPNTQLSISATKSDENDYHSLSGSLDIKQDLFEKNSNLFVNYTFFNDDYDPIQPETTYVFENSEYSSTIGKAGSGLGGTRKVNSGTLGWTQTFSTRILGMLNWGVTWSKGYLGRPYYHVTLENSSIVKNETIVNGEAVKEDDNISNGGMFYLETYPNERLGNALVARIRGHYPSFIKEGSTQVEYRRYDDTWGLNSDTYTLLINQYLSNSVFLQLRYRHYIQTSVSFYKDRYFAEMADRSSPIFQSYFTVDPRLANFTSRLFQAKLVFILKNFFKPSTDGVFAFFPTRFDIEVERYLRSTHEDKTVRLRRYEFYDEEGLKAWVLRTGFVFNY